MSPNELPQVVAEILRIPRSDNLDPITVYLENIGGGHGRATIVCYNEAWTCYWGAMGNLTLREFIANCDAHYVSGNMVSGRRRVSDTERDYVVRVAQSVIDAIKADRLSTLTAQGGEEYGIDGAISGAVDSEEVAYVSGTETDKRVRLTVNILRMPVGTKLYATPPAPSSSAVEGLVADWNRQADYARGCSAQRKRDGKDHNWFDACADTFTVAANKLKEALASTAASGGEKLSEHGRKALGRCIEEMRTLAEQAQDYGFDEMTVAAFETAIESMQIRLTTAAPAMPDGFVMVPRKSTDAMHMAYTRAKYEGPQPVKIPDLWDAMLAASAQGDGDGK